MISVEQIDKQLRHIARQVMTKAANPRVEFDDMLQEARIGAWRGIVAGQKKGLGGDDLRRYALAAGKNEAQQAIRKFRGDALYHSENYGLIEDLQE